MQGMTENMRENHGAPSGLAVSLSLNILSNSASTISLIFFRDLSVNLHLRPMAIEDSSFIYSSIQLAGSPPRLSNDLLVVVRQNA